MFVDTDVMIWGLRKEPAAVRLLDSLADIWISSIVYMELLQGARNRREMESIIKAVRDLEIRIIHVNASISQKAIDLIRQYALSRSLYQADALIAATAIHYEKALITANDKHFSIVPNLTLQIFRPDPI
jgi:predicted nucleic acid-binding protein